MTENTEIHPNTRLVPLNHVIHWRCACADPKLLHRARPPYVFQLTHWL